MTNLERLKPEVVKGYFRTGSVDLRPTKLAVHRDRPDLPLSPWYLHYPDPDHPEKNRRGTRQQLKHLPGLYQSIGQAFLEVCREQDIYTGRIAAVPRGAWPLAKALNKANPTSSLVVFDKIQLPNEETKFPLKEAVMWQRGEHLVLIEDHATTGRTLELVANAARNLGFVVEHALAVVDRQQGGAERLREEADIELHSIMDAAYLLDSGVKSGDLTIATAEEIIRYTQNSVV